MKAVRTQNISNISLEKYLLGQVFKVKLEMNGVRKLEIEYREFCKYFGDLRKGTGGLLRELYPLQLSDPVVRKNSNIGDRDIYPHDRFALVKTIMSKLVYWYHEPSATYDEVVGWNNARRMKIKYIHLEEIM